MTDDHLAIAHQHQCDRCDRIWECDDEIYCTEMFDLRTYGSGWVLIQRWCNECLEPHEDPLMHG